MAKQNNNEEYEELAAFLGELTHDPVKFVYAAFPWGEGDLTGKKPQEWQLSVLALIRDGLADISTAIRIAIASGHGIGKSACVSWLILWAISTHEDTRGVVTANTDTQLRAKTWAELAKWYRLFIAKDLFKLTATSIFSIEEGHEKTWRIDAIPWSKDNPEAFAGLHNQGKRILILFDEASAIIDEIWTVAEGATTDSDTEVVFAAFGNPTRSQGRFFECFNSQAKYWKHKQIDSRNVAISNKQQLNEWVEMYGEDSDFVKIRVRGVFPSQSDNQLISRDLAEMARRRELVPKQYEFAPVVIGVDPAWSGDDTLEIVMRQGLYSRCLETVPRNDNDMMIARKVARWQDEYTASAVFRDMAREYIRAVLIWAAVIGV